MCKGKNRVCQNRQGYYCSLGCKCLYGYYVRIVFFIVNFDHAFTDKVMFIIIK